MALITSELAGPIAIKTSRNIKTWKRNTWPSRVSCVLNRIMDRIPLESPNLMSMYLQNLIAVGSGVKPCLRPHRFLNKNVLFFKVLSGYSDNYKRRYYPPFGKYYSFNEKGRIKKLKTAAGSVLKL
jgi:hypothetical protein